MPKYGRIKAPSPAEDPITRILSGFFRSIYGADSLPAGAKEEESPVIAVGLYDFDRDTGEMTSRGKLRFCRQAGDMRRALLSAASPNPQDTAVFFTPGVLFGDEKTTRGDKHSARCEKNMLGVRCLWTDIDLDALPAGTTLDTVHTVLEGLPCPPNIVVETGGGVHAYWRLDDWFYYDGEDEPREARIARITAVLKRLAKLVGGDTSCTDVARYLRLPCSANWKRGKFITRLAERRRARQAYSLEQLDAMCDGPPLLANVKAKPAAAGRDESEEGERGFLRSLVEMYAQQRGKSWEDIVRDIETITYLGTGKGGNCHVRVRDCAASLIASGVLDVDVVTDALIELLRAQPFTMDWPSWEKERRKIHAHTLKWRRRLEENGDLPKVEINLEEFKAGSRANDSDDLDDEIQDETVLVTDRPESGTEEEPADERIVDFKQAREQRRTRQQAQPKERAKPGPKEENKKSARLGASLAKLFEAKGWQFALIGANPWQCDHTLWSELQPKALEHELASMIEAAAFETGIPTSRQLVNETMARMKRMAGVFHREADVRFDAHGFVAAMDEDQWTVLLDWRGPEGVRMVRRAKPQDWCTRRVPLPFEPGAECPQFERFVKDVFQDRSPEGQEEIYQLLGEICGTSMVARRPRELRTLLYLLGPSYTGKSQLLEVIGAILGEHIITTPLVELSRPHGTQEFAHGGSWILHEAHEGSQVVGETSDLKKILSGEPFQINPKNLAPLTFRFEGLAAFGTNNPARFRDASDAVVNRTHMLETRHIFEREERVGVVKAAYEAKYPSVGEYLIAYEGSGILNWLMDGLRRAWARGHLGDTAETVASRNEMRDEANQLRECMRECCDPDPDGMVDTRDFRLMVEGWWAQNGRGQRMPVDLGDELRKLSNDKIAADRKELRKTSARFYCGIRLNEAGMYAWDTGRNDALGKDAGADYRMTPRKDVNQTIPREWSDKPVIRRMRDAHRLYRGYLFTQPADRAATDKTRHDRS